MVPSGHRPWKSTAANGASTDAPSAHAGEHRGMAPILSAVELTKRFGDVTAVRDLSFDVDAGTVTGYLGPNGAGKTTTLRMLLGLAAPTRGRALVFDRRFDDVSRPATRVGAVLQAADLHPGRSGRDHLRVLAMGARLPAGRPDG